MNLSPILRMLPEASFARLIKSMPHREARPYIFARFDREFEFHIELPGTDPEPMATWLHDERVFPDAD